LLGSLNVALFDLRQYAGNVSHDAPLGQVS
jgi:hypothetical protein